MSTSQLKSRDSASPADATEYRAVSPLAIVALVVGLLSALALAAPVLWIVPLLGLLISSAALLSLQEGSGLVGRPAALAGLAFSIFFGTAAPTAWLAADWRLDRDAQAFGLAWFDFLARGETHRAHQLGVRPTARRPLNDAEQLWAEYRRPGELHDELEVFVARPLIKKLVSLDAQAVVRHVATRDALHEDQRDTIRQLYAVSRSADDQQPLYVELVLERSPSPTTKQPTWRIVNYGETSGPK